MELPLVPRPLAALRLLPSLGLQHPLRLLLVRPRQDLVLLQVRLVLFLQLVASVNLNNSSTHRLGRR